MRAVAVAVQVLVGGRHQVEVFGVPGPAEVAVGPCPQRPEIGEAAGRCGDEDVLQPEQRGGRVSRVQRAFGLGQGRFEYVEAEVGVPGNRLLIGERVGRGEHPDAVLAGDVPPPLGYVEAT